MSSLKFKLAYRNLFHDRLRFIATIIGIVFSIVLVTVQAGLYVGFRSMVTTMIDHSPADLWIMPAGTKCFEDPSLLDDRQRFRALAIDGVLEATPLVIGFSDWRLAGGEMTPVFIVGTDLRDGGLQPWNVVEGNVQTLAERGAVAVDRSYFERLGASGIGSTAEIRGRRVRVAVMTEGHPLVHHDTLRLCGVEERAHLHRNADRPRQHLLVRLKDGVDRRKGAGGSSRAGRRRGGPHHS